MVDQSVIGLGILVFLALIFNFSLHRIEEGHVGVYFRVSNYFIFIVVTVKNYDPRLSLFFY